MYGSRWKPSTISVELEGARSHSFRSPSTTFAWTAAGTESTLARKLVATGAFRPWAKAAAGKSSAAKKVPPTAKAAGCILAGRSAELERGLPWETGNHVRGPGRSPQSRRLLLARAPERHSP